jgi:uncharacterized membrane protein YbhN (UPF0104 family)
MGIKTYAASPGRSPMAYVAAVVGASLVGWLCWLESSRDSGLTETSEWSEWAAGAAGSFSRVPWLVVTASILAGGLAGLHYLLAGLALRASSGRRLPLHEAALSQVAASVLNRLAPAGVGGAVVNVRYLTRRGLPTGSALMAIGALDLLGALVDVLTTGLMVFTGGWVGLGGGKTELQRLTATGVHWFPSGHAPPVMSAILGLGVLGVAIYCIASGRRRFGTAAALGAGQAWRHFFELVKQPARAVTLMFASGGTTLVLALGFALVVSAVMTGGAVPSPAALMVAYLVGAAAASAVHVPAIAGPAELALTGALVASGVPAGQAIVSVLLFRGITFWAPVPVGLFALRWLRNRGAL